MNNFSHPGQPVRHSYPLAIKDDGLSTAFSLTLKTLPFIIIRFAMMLAFIAAVIIWLVICGGIAYLFSGKDGGGGGGLVIFFLAFVLPATAYYWFKQYVLYLLKAGHVAVITRLITDGELPQGTNQVAYGKEIVLKHFAQINVLVAVDVLVRGIVRAFNRTLDWVASLLPIPGLDGLMRIVNAIVDRATTFIDETILSYNIARGDENVWRSSMDGLVYYAANVKPILKTAVISIVVEYALTFIVFLLLLGPALFIGGILPSVVSGYAWLIAVMLAFAFKAAILSPVCLTMVALTFHKSVQNQPINESLEGTLSSATNKFGRLKEKAASFVGAGSAPAVARS